MALLDDVKISLRVTTNAYDSEINDLIDSAKKDLQIAGIMESVTVSTADMNKAVVTAIKTYCKMNFGNPQNYENLKKSYDEQKAQMSMSTGYTDWGNS
ncbi:MAG: head-tail connector protein [Bacteroidales bacterium]|mgnify:CR=1 FL=1|jgi:hypothetical protein|nr:head-tail connector protein [Bacteroidales bacterium]